MMNRRGPHAIAAFALRFLLASVLLLPLWWLTAPYYGWLLVQGCGTVLRDIFGMPISAGNIQTAGIMNTESLLTFYIGNNPTHMKFVELITNVPPFLALITASPGLSLRRKAAVSLLGSAILCAGHALFIILALRYAPALQSSTEIPTALAQFFATLPFLLWIVLAFGLRPNTGPVPPE